MTPPEAASRVRGLARKDTVRERQRLSNGNRDNEAGARLLTPTMAVSSSGKTTGDSDRRRSRWGGEIISVAGGLRVEGGRR